MSNSTPISHLPQQPSVVNSQQELLAGDDDATIQEVLNQITGGSGAPTPPHPPPQQQVPIQNVQPIQPPRMQIPPAMYPSQNMNQNAMMDPMQLLQMMQEQPPSIAAGPNTQPSSQQTPQNNVFNILMFALTEDFKLATIIFVAYVVIQFIPITKLLEKYFSLEKIPYSNILIKGAIASVVIVLAKKALMK